jgi:hypothetical protein
MQDRALRDEPLDQDRGAWVISSRPQLMLSLRFKDGNRRALSYTELCGTEYKKDVLALFFYQATIRMRGKGLDELADGVERQCAQIVREQHIAEFRADEASRYIERVEIGQPNIEALSGRRLD